MALYECGGGGGAKFKSGTFTTSSANQQVTVNCGFRPKYIAILFNGASGSESSAANGSVRIIYNSDYSTTYQQRAWIGSGGGKNADAKTISTSNNTCICAISDTGFTYKNSDGSSSVYSGTFYYFAVG